jgi:hypothetical protein
VAQSLRKYFFASNDSLFKAIITGIAWVVLAVLQSAYLLVWGLLTSLVGAPWAVVHLPLYLCWLLFGLFLYECKLTSVKAIAKMWFGIWTGTGITLVMIT